MDIALRYNPDIGGLDISLDGADLLGEDTLTTAVMMSLLCDRLAQPGEVPDGTDPRGWWADAYAEPAGDQTGSRLWLIEREKQLPAVVQRARRYVQEALQWIVDDGLAKRLAVTAFVPQTGWLVVDAVLELDGESRRYRFAWDDTAQVWRLQGEGFEVVA
ncbi:phage GP46 family protein [Pseudacidovorax intermedius]|uniref:phage GP46 family protein n=1 Tax=Pseudacidovorax intermedius TaxID=433924 RepID=UPI0026F11D8C|nr:phage GP46 family protein [Pseudacidovorax intermedius]